jgi:hypothetical protein
MSKKNIKRKDSSGLQIMKMKILTFTSCGFIDKMKKVIKSESRLAIGSMILIALIIFTKIVKLQSCGINGR